MEQLLYTPSEVCDFLRIGRTTFYALLAEGQLKAVKLGGRTMVHRDTLLKFVAELPQHELSGRLE